MITDSTLPCFSVHSLVHRKAHFISSGFRVEVTISIHLSPTIGLIKKLEVE